MSKRIVSIFTATFFVSTSTYGLGGSGEQSSSNLALNIASEKHTRACKPGKLEPSAVMCKLDSNQRIDYSYVKNPCDKWMLIKVESTPTPFLQGSKKAILSLRVPPGKSVACGKSSGASAFTFKILDITVFKN